jgi:hypothetical protein
VRLREGSLEPGGRERDGQKGPTISPHDTFIFSGRFNDLVRSFVADSDPSAISIKGDFDNVGKARTIPAVGTPLLHEGMYEHRHRKPQDIREDALRRT